METTHEVIDNDQGGRPVIVNCESGCGEVTINVNNVTNNYYSHPEWMTEDLIKSLVDRLSTAT